MNFSKFSLFSLFILLAAVILSACQAGVPEPCEPGPNGGICVSITEVTCPSVVAQVGQQVTWRNQGNEEHFVRVETSDGTVKFMGSDLMPGDSASATFLETGSYTLTCSDTQGTVSTLTVEP